MIQFHHKTYFNAFLIQYLSTAFIIHHATWEMLNTLIHELQGIKGISLLLFQTSHLLQWLQSIVPSKTCTVFSAIAVIQPVVEDHPQLTN